NVIATETDRCVGEQLSARIKLDGPSRVVTSGLVVVVGLPAPQGSELLRLGAGERFGSNTSAIPFVRPIQFQFEECHSFNAGQMASVRQVFLLAMVAPSLGRSSSGAAQD